MAVTLQVPLPPAQADALFPTLSRPYLQKTPAPGQESSKQQVNCPLLFYRSNYHARNKVFLQERIDDQQRDRGNHDLGGIESTVIHGCHLF